MRSMKMWETGCVHQRRVQLVVVSGPEVSVLVDNDKLYFKNSLLLVCCG